MPAEDVLWEQAVDALLSGVRSNADATPDELGLWRAFVVHYEVGNGGLWQVLKNLDAPFIDATEAFLRRLGAPHADLLAAAGRLAGALPAEDAARQDAVDWIDPSVFAALDDAWYDADPSLEAIVGRYLRGR